MKEQALQKVQPPKTKQLRFRPTDALLRVLAVSPHIIRHATAMAMLQSGVALEVIALWLGHESPATTQCLLRRVGHLEIAA